MAEKKTRTKKPNFLKWLNRQPKLKSIAAKKKKLEIAARKLTIERKKAVKALARKY